MIQSENGDIFGEIPTIFTKPIQINPLDVKLIVEEFIDNAIIYNMSDYRPFACHCQYCKNTAYNSKIFIHKPDCLVLIAQNILNVLGDNGNTKES